VVLPSSAVVKVGREGGREGGESENVMYSLVL